MSPDRRDTDPLIGKPGTVSRLLSRVDGPIQGSGKGPVRCRGAVPETSFIVQSRYRLRLHASIDTIVAEAAVGVLIVTTHRNSPGRPPPPAIMVDAKGAAETQEQADHAATLICVKYLAQQADTAFFDQLKSKAITWRFGGRTPCRGGAHQTKKTTKTPTTHTSRPPRSR